MNCLLPENGNKVDLLWGFEVTSVSDLCLGIACDFKTISSRSDLGVHRWWYQTARELLLLNMISEWHGS